MADKLNPKTVSISLTIVSVILSLACAISIMIAPSASISFIGSIFHGIDFTTIEAPVTFPGMLVGVAAIAIFAFIAGWLFTLLYNYFNK